MAKTKYYAVKVGKNPGIYKTWPECQKQVMGYSSAVYKSFFTLEEAEAFINGGNTVRSDKADEDRVIIYVDGSFDIYSHKFSYGMVVIKNGGEECYNRAFEDEELSEMRNVAGEINGSMAAMKYCLENGIDDVILYYDYQGIAKWPLKEWKANKTGTKAYVAYYDSIKDRLNVEFRHVKGHSGDKYNDMVDKLAKQALGLA